MNSRISSLPLLRALPWGDLPTLKGSKLCAYATQQPGKKHIYDVIKDTFDLDTTAGQNMADQFLYVFYDVMNESLDARDRGHVCLSDVPTNGDKSWIRSPYGAEEVAAWWNETVSRVKNSK